MIDNSYIEAARSAGADLLQVIFEDSDPNESIRYSCGVGAYLFTDCRYIYAALYADRGKDSKPTLQFDIAHRVNYFRDFGVANALDVFSYIMVIATAVYYLKMNIKDAKPNNRSFR